jgi:hypothetical protein
VLIWFFQVKQAIEDEDPIDSFDQDSVLSPKILSEGQDLGMCGQLSLRERDGHN